MFITRRGILYPFSSFDANAQALIARMIAAGETPTSARQNAINTCILSLKANSLFDTMFDVLVVTRAHGAASAVMNWIKNANNGIPTGSPTFTTDVGFSSAGYTQYINSNYAPASQGTNFTSLNAGFLLKLSGTITGGYGLHGTVGATYADRISIGSGACSDINSSTIVGTTVVIGYNAVVRTGTTNITDLRNNNAPVVSAQAFSTLSATNPAFILSYNAAGSPWNASNCVGEIVEIYGFSKSMTQAQFLTFQTIMNTYFTTT
jgi:hypothetical protein